MIVVMPFGHAAPYGARGGLNNNTELYEQYVLKDVMPLIESKYRVAPGRANRAITGYSMGGGQALTIGLRHLDLFSALGTFSGAVMGDFEKQFPQVVASPKDINANLRVFLDRLRQAGQPLRKVAETFGAADGAPDQAHFPADGRGARIQGVAAVPGRVLAVAVPVAAPCRDGNEH